MRYLTLIALLTFSPATSARFAEPEVCDNLDILEGMSDEELTEYQQWADEYLTALLKLTEGEDSESSAPILNDLAKHEMLVQVATCYISGRGTERDIDKAMALLQGPADADYPSAVHILASLRLFSTDDPELQHLGFAALEREYEEGSAYSAGKLGWAYQRGLAVEPDREKAVELYEYAAGSGMTYWQYLLAHAYEKGYLGLEVDEERAAYWLNFKPRVHVDVYECWVANYYTDGTFPPNEQLEAEYRQTCEATDIADIWKR